MSKPEMVFIFPNCMGGVASFNRNLINFTTLNSQCFIRVILLEPEGDTRPKFTDEIRADEVIHFSYSALEKQYDICLRLLKNAGNKPGCIITDSNVVLNMAAIFNPVKKLIYLVHDYFYVAGALQYQPVIDVAVAHASLFCDILLAASPDYQGKVKYLSYGVELPRQSIKKQAGPALKLIFLGRLVEEKGVKLLKEIDALLSERNVPVEWTIVGKGPLLGELKQSWSQNTNVEFVQAADTASVYAILEHQDILVFPSWFEGTPVSIMEALSRGVVPVVSNLPGGTRDMVTEDVGMLCTVKDAAAYADAISFLHSNRDALSNMQSACLDACGVRFDIRKASDTYFNFFLEQAARTPSSKQTAQLIQLSRLDKSFLPGWAVYNFRKFRRYLFQK